MQLLCLSLLILRAFGSVAPPLLIATFDGAEATTREWEPFNDREMGGNSTSSLKIDDSRKLAVWTGDVEIVPYLKAPSFCNLQSPPDITGQDTLGKTASFPDISASDGIIVRAREVDHAGLMDYKMQLTTKGAKKLPPLFVASYSASVLLTGDMADHFIPWSAFTCTWHGQKVPWCPQLTTQLNQIDGIGLGTASVMVSQGDRQKWSFTVEIESLSAKASSKPENAAIESLSAKASSKPENAAFLATSLGILV